MRTSLVLAFVSVLPFSLAESGTIHVRCGESGLSTGKSSDCHTDQNDIFDGLAGDNYKPHGVSLLQRQRPLAERWTSLWNKTGWKQEPFEATLGCRDTPGWTNGNAMCSEQSNDTSLCSPLGWTCAGYLATGYCRSKRIKTWAAGETFNNPEAACCACGGGIDVRGSCKTYGCFRDYSANQTCQCHSTCKINGNCCSDFDSTCNYQRQAGSCQSIGCNGHYDPASTCQCTDECPKFNNCCHDYDKMCRSCKGIGCNGNYDESKSCQCTSECHKYNNCCSDYDGTCGDNLKYTPGPGLSSPSDSKSFSFFVYRAVNDEESFYKLPNMNTASLGGVLWYLHNEVISTCDGSGFMSDSSDYEWGDRKFAISRILRYKVTMRPTTPLLKKGMNFAVLCSFDSGECTGPHKHTSKYGEGTGPQHAEEWNEYGFAVGCGRLGDWPHADFHSAKSYPEAVWYSFPDECPLMNFRDQTKQCEANWPGGVCAEPNGTGTCTHTYEFAGEIDIDEMVGIKPKWKNRADFCTQCGYEGGAHGNGKGGCGIDFWAYINDRSRNKKRVARAAAMFDDKYPDSPKVIDMEPPTCDFDRKAYGI